MVLYRHQVFSIFTGVVSLLTFAGSSLMQVDMSGCYTIDDNLVNDEMLERRYERFSELKINLGGEKDLPLVSLP